MTRRISQLSKDKILVPVDLIVTDGGNPDPTQDAVQFQLIAGGLPPRQQPTDEGWVDGEWSYLDGGQLCAGVLIGPGTDVGALSPGRWAVWITIADNPTAPVEAVDTIVVY